MNTSNPVRVRFAPSPTGFLHIGGVRTALFNYLFAKQKGGKFLMRIEDTDLDRSETRFTDDIMASMKWLGLEHEEEILYQSKRLDLYKGMADDLVKQGLAYRCYCTAEEVDATREQLTKEGKKPMYGRTCRDKNYHLTGGPDGRTAYAIRAKFPLEGTTFFADMIRGEISFPNVDLDDFVMIRTNGVPTYNYVVVVDDIEMKISHVIRGDDHINNTPKQIFLYEALKAAKPLFAHLPMILGQDKKKLSKRNGETSANAYRTEGYLPEAVLNFLVRLGWSHGDQEVFTREQMIELFDLSHVQVSGAVFNVEKLMWIAGEQMKLASNEKLLAIVKEDFSALLGTSVGQLSTTYAHELVTHLKPKVKLVKELAEQLEPLLEAGVMTVDATTLKWNKDEALKAKIKEAISAIKSDYAALIVSKGAARLSECGITHTEVETNLRASCEKFGIKLGDLTQPMRLFVTGKPTSSIGLFDLMPLMSWKTIDARLGACLLA